MSIITIRLDEALYRRVKLRAANAQLSISEFLRPVIEDVAFPGGRYAYTGQDELLSVSIQTFAILAALASETSPQVVERGMADARHLLRERGLLDPHKDALSEVGKVTRDDVGDGR